MKQRHQQQKGEDQPESPSRFSALISEPMARRSAIALKLTDECSAAVHEAAAGHRKIRLHHKPDACYMEVAAADGSTKRFECAVQPMGYPIDAINYDEPAGQYRTVAALQFKIQVRATDRTFAETREKAQKLVEEQQKHKAKDMNSRIHARAAVTASSQRRLLSGVAAAATKPKTTAIVSIRPSNALAPNLSGSAAVASTVTKPPATISSTKFGITRSLAPGGIRTQSATNRSPLGSQSSIASRTAAVADQKSSPVTGTSPTVGGPSSRIGYAPRNPPPTFRKRLAPSSLASVGKDGKDTALTTSALTVKDNLSGPLSKPSSLMPELDSSNGSSRTQVASSLAASTMALPAIQLSQHQSGNTNNSGGSGGPPPEKRRAPYPGGYGIMSTGNSFVAASGGGGGEADAMPAIQPTADTTPSPSPSSAASSTMDSPPSTYGGGGSGYRSSHHINPYSKPIPPSSYHHHRDRDRQDRDRQPRTTAGGQPQSALSQPLTDHQRQRKEDSWRPTADAKTYHRRPMSAQQNNNITDNGSVGGGLTRETRPSRNYREVFREICDLNEAKQYHDIFAAEYPEYRECYELLSRVSAEFHALERALKLTDVNTPDRDKMEDAIQSKFAVYQNDENFLQKRQRHTDLRAKLDVLKQRIIDWERRQLKQQQRTGDGHPPRALSDMMVM